MAIPRIFVSSTCYDLQEIRFQLKSFIKEFGYESALSEFDDIFYNYDKHVQDSCLEEIPKCQLFILVIGNNYGSIYHKENQQNKVPDSVTLKEFKRALDQKISKHIFVNRFVDYDYKNYRRALEKEILKFFQENNVPDDKITDNRYKVKEMFDQNYYFSSDSYKYVFYFLDIIYELREGNSIIAFESFNDIKESLKKQWAGLIYEALTKTDRDERKSIDTIETKISNIEKNILMLLQSKTYDSGANITFDVTNLSKEINIENLEKIQDRIQSALWNICNYVAEDGFSNSYNEKRIVFDKKINVGLTKKWLESLQEIIQSYKWSKYIHLENLFKEFPVSKYDNTFYEVSYKSVLDLYTIFISLAEEDESSFIVTVCQELNKNFEEPRIISKNVTVLEDDLPF